MPGVRTTVFLLLALAFTTTAGAGSAPPVPTPVPGARTDQSVADRSHRWRLAGTRDAEGRYRFVDATENGGRTWHRILRRPAHDVVRITRTTARDGFVYVDAEVPVLATADDGRTWRRLAIAPRPDATLFEGSGADLFYGVRTAAGVEFGGYVMKVSHAAQGHTLARPFVGPPDSYGRHYVALQPIRWGIASLVEGRPVDGSPGVAFRIDVARLSIEHTRIDHTVINVSRAPGASCSARLFRVEWPAIRIVAPVLVAPAQTCDADAVSHAFVSRDGGRTWRVAPGR